MATWELQLVSRIVRTGDLNTVIQWGITPDDFLTNEGRALYSSIQGYFSMPHTSGAVLGPYAVQQMFPHFVLCDDTSMTTDALCVEVRQQRLKIEFRTRCQGALELCDYNVLGAINQMQTNMLDLQNVGMSQNTDVHFHTSFDRSMQRYYLLKQGVDLSCGSWPWWPLQEATMGIQHDDYVVIYGRPKCVPVGTEVLTASGEFLPIETAREVMGVGHQTQRLDWVGVEHKTEIVRRKVVRIKTKSGYEATVGEDHPLLRPDFTYAEAGQLQIGDHIGVARQIPWNGGKRGSTSYFEMLGLLVGDGNYTRNEVQFTNIDRGIVSRLRECAAERFCKLEENKHGHFRLTRDRSLSESAEHTNPVLDILRQESMWGKTSLEKTAPKSLFSSNRACIAAFLGGLLSTDGGVYDRTVRWNTSSLLLAKQIKHLLLRLGVVGSLGEVTTNIGTASYTINVQSQEQHLLLLGTVGRFIASEAKLEKLLNICQKRHLRKRQDDSIPRTAALEAAILDAFKRHGEWPRFWCKFSRGKLFRRSGKISRELLRSLARGMDAPELLVWADSDVRWEPIVEIEHLGETDCIDIGVGGDHNFLVGDIITHNSMKSWCLAYLISWFYEMGKRMVIYTKEMTADNIFQRAGACLGIVRYQLLRTGKLSWEEEASLYAVQRMLHFAQQAQTVVCLSAKDAVEGGDTVPWLRSKVDQYRPDIVFIDGMYLMSDVKSAQKDNVRVMNISRAIRQMNLDTKVPVIATVQANRDAAKNNKANLDEIAFSDALGQDATLLMRAINEHNQPTIALVMGGASREFHLSGFRIFGQPAFNFDYAGEISDKEIEKAKEQDIDEESGNAKRVPASKRVSGLRAEKKAQDDTIVRLDQEFGA